MGKTYMSEVNEVQSTYLNVDGLTDRQPAQNYKIKKNNFVLFLVFAYFHFA